MTKPKVVEINQQNYHKIKDIAHRLWVATRHPNSNLVMFEALKQFIELQGGQAGYEVPSIEEFKK